MMGHAERALAAEGLMMISMKKLSRRFSQINADLIRVNLRKSAAKDRLPIRGRGLCWLPGQARERAALIQRRVKSVDRRR